MGWGFVVRGGRPCHIQAVDPGGPAAAAGMKVLLTRGDLIGGRTYVLFELFGLNTSSVIIPPPAVEISPGKVHCVCLRGGGFAFCQGGTGAVGS